MSTPAPRRHRHRPAHAAALAGSSSSRSPSQRQPQAVRILLTGYADSLVDEKVAQWRLVDAWVSKPIDSAALKTSIAQAIEKRTAPARSAATCWQAAG